MTPAPPPGCSLDPRLRAAQLSTPAQLIRPLHASFPPCSEVCKAAYDKIKDLRAAHDAKWAAYKENNTLWRKQQDEEYKAK